MIPTNPAAKLTGVGIASNIASAVAASFVALAVFAPAALGHAQPILTEPAQGLQLTESPDSVKLYYEEPVQGLYLRVYDERGGRVDEGEARVEPGVQYEDPLEGVSHEALYSVDLKELGAGSYTVESCVESEDGHEVGASHEFRVLEAGAASTASESAAEDEGDDRCELPEPSSKNGGRLQGRSDERPSAARVAAFGGLGFAGVVAAIGTAMFLRRRG